jgi:ribosomal protein L40E
MTERWVCPRCYTSAEESATVCPNCGTPRGAALASATGSSGAEHEAGPPPEATPPESAPPPDAATPQPDPSSPTTASASGERWVCLRCFVSNEGSAAECANCGLLRGAEPPADDPGTWAAAQQAQAAGGGRGFPWRWVGFGVVALLVLGGSILFAARRDDSGEITGAGTLSVQDLQVGDCFDLEDERTADTTEVSTVRAIPCDQPHTYEMYFAGDYPAGELPTAPDEPYSEWEEGSCVGSFESYVGIDFDSSRWYFSSLTPTDESWDAGDRLLQCFLHNLEETAVTGSAEGTAE